MKTIFKYILDLFFPPCCLVCQQRLITDENFICIGCLSELPKTNYIQYPKNKFEDIFAGKFPFQRAAAMYSFTKGGALQSIIHELKYNNNPRIGQFLGELMSTELADSDFISDINIIVPVPLHPKRRKERGYNQSEEVVKGIINKIPKQHEFSNLKRIANNTSQTGLNRMERWENVENIFTIEDLSIFEGQHILLIDDIITTGATIESCAKKILSCCPNSKISILSVGATI